MRYRDLPIKSKLILAITLTSAVLLLLACLAFISYEWFSFRKEMLRSVTTLARIIASNSSAALAFRNAADAREILGALGAEENINRAALYDENKKLFAWYPQSKHVSFFPAVPESAGYSFTADHLVVYQPVQQGNRTYGTLYLDASLGILYIRLRSYVQIAFLILLIAILTGFLLSGLVQRTISEPVLSLSGAARAVSDKKDYAVRVPVTANDEIGNLTTTFNAMLQTIQESDAGLRQAIKEKDVLIQEVHHRVKNNLQVILSMLDMQARHLQSKEAIEVFEDCKGRIRSMSLVHEMLYGAGDLSKIDFMIYTKKLVSDLVRSYSRNLEVNSEIEISQIELDIRKAVPLGLMLNEILTNSFKHAFINRSSGLIFVRQQENEKLVLVAGDNGIGLPQNINLDTPITFGLKIIRLLAQQVNADIMIDTSSSGTLYTIRLH